MYHQFISIFFTLRNNHDFLFILYFCKPHCLGTIFIHDRFSYILYFEMVSAFLLLMPIYSLFAVLPYVTKLPEALYLSGSLLNQLSIIMMTMPIMLGILLFLFFYFSVFKIFNILAFRYCLVLKKLELIKISLLPWHIINFIVLISLRKCVSSVTKEKKICLVSLLGHLLLPS